MKYTLVKIALVIILVLSVFLVILHFSFPSSGLPVHETNLSATVGVEKHSLQTGNNQTVLSPAVNTSVADIKAVLGDKNRTLDKAYKSVASEIEDFLNTRKHIPLDKDENKSEVNFTSVCPLPPEKLPPIVREKEKKPLNRYLPETVQKKQRKKVYRGLPRLVIIMDDVRSLEQGKMIKRLPFKVTPSIFPVTVDHPDTKKVARMFRCYMVHTPMEAFHYPKEEENTLETGDSLQTIERRIRAIKHDFPRLTAINNHTGSKFTSDPKAMDRLFCALQKYGIRFVDSRTAPTTKACQIGELHGTHVLSRNVFLDNVDDVDAILARLRESVEYAKKHKVAIAICHPRPATFEALMRAKPLLKGVHVVTIDALYR